MRRLVKALALASLAAALTTACGSSRSSGICADPKPDPTVKGDPAALAAEGEEAWKLRADTAQLVKAIDAWDRALKIKPNQPDLRVKLARAHYFLADGHLRFDEEKGEEMISNFEKGANHAELALGQKYPEYRSKYCARRPLKVALGTLDKGAVPAMYWFATNLGKYGLAKSIVVVLNEKDRIKATMELIKELQPDFFHGAADRYFGAYHTKIPFPNGDLPASKASFEASLKRAPNYIGTRVLYAELYSIKAKDRETFKAQLEQALAYDVESIPDIKPEMIAEKKKAQALLDEIDVYFPED